MYMHICECSSIFIFIYMNNFLLLKLQNEKIPQRSQYLAHPHSGGQDEKDSPVIPESLLPSAPAKTLMLINPISNLKKYFLLAFLKN